MSPSEFRALRYVASFVRVGILVGAAAGHFAQGDPLRNAPPRRGTLASSPASTLSCEPNLDATGLAIAMGFPPELIRGAALRDSDPSGARRVDTELGRYMPTEGSTFVVLSTGLASEADRPNLEPDLSAELACGNNSQGYDLVQLAVSINVPEGYNCASVDFVFLSEEYPEYQGPQFPYNDRFTAELGASELSIDPETGEVIAPRDFARDPAGNVISIDTVLGIGLDTGTTYDGGTQLLRAETPITGGQVAQFFFTVQDLGDPWWDSAVFLDNFRLFSRADCGRGSVPEIGNLSTTVRVNDAQEGTLVSKFPGDYVDIVLSLENSGSRTIENISSSITCAPESAVQLVDIYSTENVYDDYPERGVDVVRLPAPPAQGAQREKIFRLETSRDALGPTERHLTVECDVTVNHGEDRSTVLQTSFDLVHTAPWIIATNRYGLLRRFGRPGGITDPGLIDAGFSKAKAALAEIYALADQHRGVVVNLDLDQHDPTGEIARWNSSDPNLYASSDPDVVNKVALKVRDRIRLTRQAMTWELFPISSKPQFLLLVGGDEIVPMYRHPDPSEMFYHPPGDDPLLRAPAAGYLPIDDIYSLAPDDPAQGYGTLLVGRLPGDLDTITAALTAPRWSYASEGATLASRDGWDLGNIPDTLRDLGFNVRNDDPAEGRDTIDNGHWTKADVVNALNTESQDIFVLGGHADHTSIFDFPDDPDDLGLQDIRNLTSVPIYRPVVALGGCHAGLPASSSLALTFLGQGARSVVGAVGWAPGSSIYGPVWHAEEMLETFFEEWMGTSGLAPRPTESRCIGKAVAAAKNTYLAWNLDPTAAVEKSMLEFQLFGAPWQQLVYRDQLASAPQSSPSAAGYSVTVGVPVAIGDQRYRQLVDVHISEYAIETAGDYSIVTIPGTKSVGSATSPVLPVLEALRIPRGATLNVESVHATSSDPLELGPLPLPAVCDESPSTDQRSMPVGYCEAPGSGTFPPTAARAADLNSEYVVLLAPDASRVPWKSVA